MACQHPFSLLRYSHQQHTIHTLAVQGTYTPILSYRHLQPATPRFNTHTAQHQPPFPVHPPSYPTTSLRSGRVDHAPHMMPSSHLLIVHLHTIHTHPPTGIGRDHPLLQQAHDIRHHLATLLRLHAVHPGGDPEATKAHITEEQVRNGVLGLQEEGDAGITLQIRSSLF